MELVPGLPLRNRVVMAPMTTWASNDDGTVSDEEDAYYRRRENHILQGVDLWPEAQNAFAKLLDAGLGKVGDFELNMATRLGDLSPADTLKEST
jgi:hypothetical protein